ncbi:peptidoglycan-binding protein [uncultured Flavobacterium sp.]|uniref:peptidoglycan-binding protein n=1 Tax=uncultured Flavobacterium sp. TaxID=165435 RepID=UPI0025F4662E|nr:peptidoglycan-binding protein [uncultured Flavobacterium sp.]
MNKVLEFQDKYGLVADGIIGRATLDKMKFIFGLRSGAQLAHLLANVDHETGGFRADTENLAYNATALARTWPKRYKNLITGTPNSLAILLANKPQDIANNVYADRMGNGDEASGEGWKYRGRGALQLTGKNNYKLFSDFIGDDRIMDYPDLVASKYFWESALFYFTKNKLWNRMNKTAHSDVKAIRKAVNGGYIGLDSVQQKFDHYHNLLSK